MFQNFRIRNLRGIREVHLEGLKPINLIVGRNNSGKTTLLEGLFLMGGATNPVFPLTLGQLRGQRTGRGSPDAIFRPLFHGLDPSAIVKIDALQSSELASRHLAIEALPVTSFTGNGQDFPETATGVAAVTENFDIAGLRLSYTMADGTLMITSARYDPRTGIIEAPGEERADLIRTTFLSARSYPSLIRDAEQFSQLLRMKLDQDAADAVRIIEPSVQRIEVLSEPGGPSVYVDVGLESLVPLAVCGEGFVRLFSIAVELASSRRGVLLIDEIDNGLHHSVMPKLWALLGSLCEKHGVQIFATTHNEELLFSALEGFKDRPEDLGLFRIDPRERDHLAVAYDAEMQLAVREHHFEVRG